MLRELKAIKEFVVDAKKDKKFQKQLNALQKTVSKLGKYIEENSKEIAILRRDSHPSQEYICCRKCGCEIAKSKIKKGKKNGK